jgi:hypothetical protein
MNFAIRKKSGDSYIWLARTVPAVVWGPRPRAKIFGTKHAASKALSSLSPNHQVGAEVVEEAECQ